MGRKPPAIQPSQRAGHGQDRERPRTQSGPVARLPPPQQRPNFQPGGGSNTAQSKVGRAACARCCCGGAEPKPTAEEQTRSCKPARRRRMPPPAVRHQQLVTHAARRLFFRKKNPRLARRKQHRGFVGARQPPQGVNRLAWTCVGTRRPPLLPFSHFTCRNATSVGGGSTQPSLSNLLRS